MTLKTLKEIGEKRNDLEKQSIRWFVNETRHEAIKWIKEKYTWKTTMDDEDTFEIEVMRRLKNDWMEFFNITEENLK